jgi:signal peptidase I
VDIMKKLQKISAYIFILFSIIACANTTLLMFNGGSMEPNIQDGQKIVSKPVKLSELQRGDIIYYEILSGTEIDGKVHRLIGLPTEQIEIKNEIIYINNEPLTEDYDTIPPTYDFGPVVLKENEYFVLGDNREGSADSHVLGPVLGNQIKGRIQP